MSEMPKVVRNGKGEAEQAAPVKYAPAQSSVYDHLCAYAEPVRIHAVEVESIPMHKMRGRVYEAPLSDQIRDAKSVVARGTEEGLYEYAAHYHCPKCGEEKKFWDEEGRKDRR